VGGSLRHDPSNDDLRETFARHGFVTASDAIMPVLRQALKAALASDVTILLEGETGTGKQVLAQAIHQLDPKRSSFPFVTAHCSAISETLAESELFGHCRGAFTGAVVQRPGLFQTANQGTLFLDEINDLPLAVQPKLLDVIQRHVVRPFGADREVPVNARIIAASNQPLQPLVVQRRFRSDLYYRLNVVRLRLPLLRERPDDLAALVRTFAERYENIYRPIMTVEHDLVDFLRTQSFAGNVRELEHIVVRMLFAKTHGTSLRLEDWHAQADGDKAEAEGHEDLIDEAAQNLWQSIARTGQSYVQAIEQLEKKVLIAALSAGGRTRKEVAQKLRTSERTLYHMIRRHHLSAPKGEIEQPRAQEGAE